MNALNTVQDAISCVLTLLVEESVHVTLDMCLVVTIGHVLVCIDEYDNHTILINVDINECNTNNGGCDTTCTNTVGSYECSCNTGYELNNDLHHCDGKLYIVLVSFNIIHLIEINECDLDTDLCEHTCTNTAGSYACSCNTGYQLGNNNHSCSGISILSNTCNISLFFRHK